MKIRPDQEKKWEAMWKKWEKPLPQDSNDDIFADMKAAVPNWKELVKKEFHGVLGAIDSSEFENAIETVLDGEDPKSKKKFWDNCVTFDRFIDTVRYVVQNDYHKFNESKLNEYYHTTVAGDLRDIDDDNPLKHAGPWERDPDYMHLNASTMKRIVALNVTPGDKDIGNILFINRPKKMFCFDRAGYYKDSDPFLPVSRKTTEEMQKFLNSPEMQSMKQVFSGKKLSDFKIKLVTFDTFIHKFLYKKGALLEKNIADLGEGEVDEASFDLLDWKNGSLTENGLKQAVDMFKAQDASKLTVVIYDRKSGQSFNIVDVNMGSMQSGHGLEIDIDTAKAILKESEKELNNEKPTKITGWKPVLSNGKTIEVNEINPYPELMVGSVERIGSPRSGKWQVLIGKQELLKSPLPRLIDANEVLHLFCEKYWRHLDEDEQEEVNDELNEASDTFDWAADGYGKGNSETYTWKVLRKIFPNLQFSMVSQQGPGGGWPEIKVSGKDRDVKRFMEWWNSAPTKDNKFWKKIMNALEKIYGKPLYDESDLNEADDREPLSHALDAVGVKASTANSKAQDEVQMTATDGDTYAGIDVAIDRDIDAAMEEIYK